MSGSQEIIDDDESIVPLDQQESESDIIASRVSLKDAVLFNTDWTVETIFSQIEKNNFDLNPKFQRREAWDITRKSKLIESIMCSLPIPNIVLAEEKKTRGKYIVIDGKQRLFAISSFFKSEFRLTGLQLLSDLNGCSFSELSSRFPEEVSGIENYPIRTVIIRNWLDENYLYTIFFRLNSGSLPLSPQELRKALHGGELLDYLDDFICQSASFKKVFGSKLDPRMRDVELVLRFVAFDQSFKSYSGNLKVFLDDAVQRSHEAWDLHLPALRESIDRLNIALDTTYQIFGSDSFKKFTGEKFERRVNRAVFDVIARYFSENEISTLAIEKREQIVEAFKELCVESEIFRNSIERTTKTPMAKTDRHVLWGRKLGGIIGKTLDQELMRLV